MASVYTNPGPISLGFEDFAWIARNGDYACVVFLSVCLYDHIATFDLEVELIWSKQVSLVQVLFLTNRYIGNSVFVFGAIVLLWAPDAHFDQLCRSFNAVNTWMALTSLTAYQGIVVHRVYSMCRRQRAVLIISMVALGALFTTALAIGIVWTIQIKGVPIFYGPTLRTCLAIGWTPWSATLWYTMLAFDMTVFCLALMEGVRYLGDRPKAAETEESSVGIESVGSSPMGSSLITKVFLRDSILFPFIGLFICVSNILAWHVLPLGTMQYTISIAALLSPILGSRLILSLRDAYYRPFADEVELRNMWS